MTGWVRSSACAAGDCIEVRERPNDHPAPGFVDIRHYSRHASWGQFTMTRAEWDAFTAGIKAGDFDQLTGDAP